MLAIVVLWLASAGIRGFPMAMVIAAALLSDIYDGILARRMDVETTALRRADSIADTIFYAASAVAAWILARQEVRAIAPLLAILIFLEIARYAFDFLKFRREASYHAYSAKAWGLVLASALILLLVFGVAGVWLRLALILGIIADLEGLAISVILPVWKRDVRSFVHALRCRRALSEELLLRSRNLNSEL